MGLFSGKKKTQKTTDPSGHMAEIIELSKAGHIEEIEFMEIFLSCDGYILDNNPDVKNGSSSNPLILNSERYGNAIAVFSDLEAAKKVMALHPDFKYACKLPIGELLFSLKDGIGLVVNMLSEKGQMQISAEQVKQIQSDFGKNDGA